jgi:hypothetical protein
MTRNFVLAFRLLGNQNRPQLVQLKCTIGAIILHSSCLGKLWGILGTLTCYHQSPCGRAIDSWLVDEPSIIIEAHLNVQEGSPPVHTRLVVDTRCQLKGVLCTDFVCHQGWKAIQWEKRVHTADGSQIQGLTHIVANLHLAPGFTRQVDYGVLDLPGYDGLLGISFLNHFTLFAITSTSDTQHGIMLTNPKNKQLVHIAGLSWEQLAMNYSAQAELQAGICPSLPDPASSGLGCGL